MAATTENKYDQVFEGIEIGTGAWSWGDRMIWNFGSGFNEKDVREVFEEAVAQKTVFFDTAEVYGQGKSETLIGQMIQDSGASVKIATKMMPFPWRLGKNALRNALQASLGRLQLSSVDLYQMHWPLKPVSVETWMQRMADLMDEGLIKAVGVSNYDLEKTRIAQQVLQKRGYRLASNQVEYHLLERTIENDGVMSYCQEQGIKIIAYSPLAMGILTGKYTPEHPPRGTRAVQYNPAYLSKVAPLLKTLSRIGNDHNAKTAGQVALNWLIRKGTLPIPGAKNLVQLQQNLGAVGWELSSEDMTLLDELSTKVTER
jgi:aryl-alcohol dehydrogenase-like predicted oxidoreductase